MEKIEEMVDVKDIDTQCDLSLKVADTQKGYFDEMVIYDYNKNVYKYSFSKNIDNLEVAIYARTGISVDLKDVTWKFYDKLPVKVRHIMATHGVNYCAVTYLWENDNYLDVIMRSGDRWFKADYIQFETSYQDLNLVKAMRLAMKWAREGDAENENDDDE